MAEVTWQWLAVRKYGTWVESTSSARRQPVQKPVEELVSAAMAATPLARLRWVESAHMTSMLQAPSLSSRPSPKASR